MYVFSPQSYSHPQLQTPSHFRVAMSDDASLPPNAPMINGQDSRPQIDGEEDASPSSTTTTTTPASVPSLEAVCADLHGRVSAFLNKTADSDSTRKVQEQVRISISVIEKALTDYECVKENSSPTLQRYIS